MRRPSPARAVRAFALALGLVAPDAAATEPLPAFGAPPPPMPTIAPPADPITLDLGLHDGFAYRVSGSGGLPITSRAGGLVGLSVAVAPSRLYAIALGYEHGLLGGEHGAGDVADVALTRSVDVLWATLRLALVHTDRVLFVVQVGPGLAFQRVDANVLVYQGAGAQPTRFACADTGGPSLGLRAGLGLEARLRRSLWLTVDGGVDNLQLSSDALGTCAPGAGSASLLGLRAGFRYRLDVSRILR